MELLANDLSVHGQFHDMATFREAFSRLMSMRAAARSYGRDVHCQRTLWDVNPKPGVSLQQAIMRFPLESERRAAMIWLTKAGPFWDDMRLHAPDDWLECRDKIVTDTAVGEAAVRSLHGVDCGLVSVSPSDWEFTPVEVNLCPYTEEREVQNAVLENWWNVDTLEESLRRKVPPVRSWSELRTASENRFESLIFSEDCFEPLAGVPFAKSATVRFLVLLNVLDRLSRAYDAHGVRTAEGHRIYREYFAHDRALFSDSSNTEKQQYRKEMTFAHPEFPGSSLSCTWHGKVSHLTLRLHFSWPIEAGKPVYVVYAGPKVTKK